MLSVLVFSMCSNAVVTVFSCGCASFFFAVGLDAAGKTTILYKLKLGEIVTTIPTIGERLREREGGISCLSGPLYLLILYMAPHELFIQCTSRHLTVPESFHT